MAPKDGTAPAAGGSRRGNDADAPLATTDRSSNGLRTQRNVVGRASTPQYDPAELEARLEHWLAFASAGYHLAPVRIRRDPAGKKRPRFLGCTQTIGWADLATTDPDTITRWLHRWGPDVGMVIACQPSGLFAVDLDLNPAAEVDALGWWARYDLPIGHMVVDTPSGGQHHYWRQHPTKPLPNTAGAIAPGVDTRGIGQTHGGFVFAPGTYVIGEESTPWRLMDPLAPITDLPVVPDEIAELIPEQRRSRRTPRAPGQAGLTAANGAGHQLSWLRTEVERQRDRLVALPPASGHGFRYALLGASMMAGRLVVAEGGDDAERELATEYLSAAVRQVWGEVDSDDAEWIATGLDDGEADPFTITPEDDAELDPESEPDEWDMAVDRELQRLLIRDAAAQRLRALQAPPRPAFAELVTSDDDLESVEPPAMAIDGLVPDRAVGWLAGPSGSYKSFVALQLAASVGYGVAALEDPDLRPLRRHRVLYVAGEDYAGVALRLRALQARAGVRGDGQVMIYRRAVDLTDPAEVEEMVSFCLAQDITFLVVDTFRQSTPGVKEIDNTEVGLILHRLLRIRDDHGIGTLLVDHTNKSATGDADLGGAGAKRANADYALMIGLPNGERGADQQRTLRVAKFKGRPETGRWPIRLEQVPAVRDADGVPQAVAVVGALSASVGDIHGDDAWRALTAPHDVADYRGRGREALTEVALFVMHQGAGESGISRSEVLAWYRKRHPDAGASPSAQRVRTAWDALHQLDRLTPVGMRTSATGAHRWNDAPAPLPGR